MNVLELCKKINAPQEMLMFVSENLASWEVLQSLTDINTAANAYNTLNDSLENDVNGLKMFACMLNAATITYEKYCNHHIAENIFIDTMSCFVRFTQEHLASYGVYGFDRGWWTYRQLSCVLFRIDELEYEYCDSEKTIHLHIPSNADITIKKCKQSLNAFRAFTAKYFPEKNYPIICQSWLLSPAIDKLLSPQSKIIKFKNCFHITNWEPNDEEFLQWVYGKPDIEYAKLPEKTKLQRNMKNYLLSGKYVGSALGQLIDFI